MDIYELEKSIGVIVSVGGQIPNNLALPLHQQGVRILGTSPDSIDKAEDRHKFSALLDKMKVMSFIFHLKLLLLLLLLLIPQVDQPRWSELTTRKDAELFGRTVGFPVLVRPSFVLSGAAISVASSMEQLNSCLRVAGQAGRHLQVNPQREGDQVRRSGPGRTDPQLRNLGTRRERWSPLRRRGSCVAGAEVVCSDSSHSEAERLSEREGVANLWPVQHPVVGQGQHGMVKIIECNLRASRTFPFISKTFDVHFITLATKVMMGHLCKPYNISLYGKIIL